MNRGVPLKVPGYAKKYNSAEGAKICRAIVAGSAQHSAAKAVVTESRGKEGAKNDRRSKSGIEFEALLKTPKQLGFQVKTGAESEAVETFKLTGLAKTCDNSRLC